MTMQKVEVGLKMIIKTGTRCNKHVMQGRTNIFSSMEFNQIDMAEAMRINTRVSKF